MDVLKVNISRSFPLAELAKSISIEIVWVCVCVCALHQCCREYVLWKSGFTHLAPVYNGSPFVSFSVYHTHTHTHSTNKRHYFYDALPRRKKTSNNDKAIRNDGKIAAVEYRFILQIRWTCNHKREKERKSE